MQPFAAATLRRVLYYEARILAGCFNGSCAPLDSTGAALPSFNGSYAPLVSTQPAAASFKFQRSLRDLVSSQPAAASSIVLARWELRDLSFNGNHAWASHSVRTPNYLESCIPTRIPSYELSSELRVLMVELEESLPTFCIIDRNLSLWKRRLIVSPVLMTFGLIRPRPAR